MKQLFIYDAYQTKDLVLYILAKTNDYIHLIYCIGIIKQIVLIILFF